MSKFYFFKSSVDNDVMSGITVFTDSIAKAFRLATKHFAKYNCKGEPQLMAI